MKNNNSILTCLNLDFSDYKVSYVTKKSAAITIFHRVRRKSKKKE